MKTPYLDDSALTHVGTEPLILSGSQDVCLGFQISQLQDGRQNKQRCDCYSCVESRNIAPVFVSPSNFRDQMLQAGFSDEDATAELREHIGSDFYEDIVFLLNRIHSLPPERPTHLSVAPNLENFLFNRSIGELRTERRTRPASERGDGAIRYGAMFSVQQKNQKAENNRNPEPFDTRKLGYCGVSAKYDGIAVPIWYRPDHFVFAKTADEAQSQFEARVFAKPQVGEHVVMVGDVRVPIDDIYSQGAFKALVDGKEMTVTDFWAVKYKSGWRGFVDPRIRMKNGDRQRCPR